MSDLKRLLIFATFLVVFTTFGVALNYRDDEPNPWYVESAMSLLFSSPYILGALVVGLLIRARVKRTRDGRER